MFDRLTGSLQKIFKNLRGYGKLTERNVQDALREVRMALLEADVHFEVARDFIARVREKCMGEDVLDSVTPGQQVIKRVHEEMIELLGRERKDFDLTGKPAMIMLLGLHGAGKTTTAGKLAKRWKKEGKRVLLTACDIRRPAAVDQLRILAEQAGVDIVTPEKGETVPALALRARRKAESEGHDILLFDTGGRFQMDNELVAELVALKDAADPKNIVLVLDAAIGQESVQVAKAFNDALGITGLILTKLDGDARGGAAMSVQHIAKCPILLVGVGERADDLEPFYPDRMASRILGMGDVISLVEKAQAAVNHEDMAKMEQRLQKDSFNFEDFLEQLGMMEKMGPLENLMEMLPAGMQIPDHVKNGMGGDSSKEWKRAKAIIQSMTVKERRNPDLIKGRRRQRIATGSGVGLADVNDLMKRFEQLKRMTKQMKKMQKRLRRARK